MMRFEFTDLAALAACVTALAPEHRARITAEAAPVHALLVPDDLAGIVEAAMAAADPVEQARSALVAYAADKRWRVETGGISVGGIDVATDDRSKLMIMALGSRPIAIRPSRPGGKRKAGFLS